MADSNADAGADDLHPEPRFGTRAIHGGQSPEPATGAVMTPIFQTSTYVQPELDAGWPYEYARVQNPTREALERNLASLEGGAHGIAFASGMSAIEAVVKRLSSGDHVLCEENVYGGTHRMFVRVFAALGLDFSFVDTRDPDRLQDGVRPETRLILVETPTNPMMRLTDLTAAATVAREAEALLLVDNTFASPFNQRPLEHGADLVVHSTTKYLNGHSDVVGGAIVTSRDDLADEIRFVRKSTGAVPGPMDAWLTLRGCKTLHVRMERHNENGIRVARFLETRDEVEAVHYPGLESHPQHELAGRQMRGYTGMVSLELGSPERARRFVEATRVFALAESLGGVESLVSVPSLMTHASVPEDKRREMGLTGGLVRLSVGIEDIDDLLEDLENALGAIDRSSGGGGETAGTRRP